MGKYQNLERLSTSRGVVGFQKTGKKVKTPVGNIFELADDEADAFGKDCLVKAPASAAVTWPPSEAGKKPKTK